MKNLTPLVEPIVTSTICTHRVPEQMGYGRVDNPTRLALEKELAKLENARFALAFSSGSAAIAAVLSLLKIGDVIIAHKQMYEGTTRMLETIFNRFGIKHTTGDFTSKNISVLKKNRLDMLIAETITNPTLEQINLKRICKLSHKVQAIAVIDNTIATPIFIQPINEGADIVVHSLTKYIAGHHDVMAGAIMTNSQKLYMRLRHIQWTLGAVPSPFDCALVMRGIQTLFVRMGRHRENAIKIAEFLRNHRRVKKVVFPGISGMVSFWFKGTQKGTIQFLMRLKRIPIAHSFGGTTSTVLHPVSMMTWSLSPQELIKQEITGNLVRMSVGIEDVHAIINDLQQALKNV